MPIYYSEEAKLFEIRTDRTSYLFGVNGKGTVQHIYWGERVEAAECADMLKGRFHSSFDADVDRETEEFGGWGGSHYAEPGLKVEFGDGVRDLKLDYAGCEIVGENELAVKLADRHYAFRVDMHYKAYPEHDIIERYVRIHNDEALPVRIEQAMAAVWSVQGLPDYRMTHVSGRWAGEYQLRRTVLSEGKKVIESRRGFTGPHANPWFAIDGGRRRRGTRPGLVRRARLERQLADRRGADAVPARCASPAASTTFDFAYPLEARRDARYAAVLRRLSGRRASARRRRHAAPLRARADPARRATSRLRPVLYNSWEATEFGVNEHGQTGAGATKAAKLGVELFVVDDGWFGARNNDRAGLGDWLVNPEKFPNGLKALIDEVNGLGMEFGLWVEPEMVNADSDLYRAHPDWVIHFPTAPRTSCATR